MRKRPLCMVVLIMALCCWLLPVGLWTQDPKPVGQEATHPPEGEIFRMECTESGQAVWLKHTNLSDAGIILVYFDAEQPYSIGNTIQIKGAYRYQEPEPARNPGQFDAKLYYQTQKIGRICYAREAVLTDDSVCPLPQLLHQARIVLRKRCFLLAGERQGGVLGAMLLGDKSALEEDLQNIYQKSGMAHLLAVSGLHVSIFGMSLYRLFRRLGCPYPAAGIPAMLLVLLYGGLTGMGTSTMRAVVMFLLAVGADMLGKSYDMLTALGTAALLLLLEQPLYARSASFLLSFGAVLGIGILYEPLAQLFPAKGKAGQAFLASLCVQLATLPLIQYFYYEIPLYAVFLNLAVIPLMTVLMFGGILAVALSFLSWRAAWLPSLLCRGILGLYEWLGAMTLRLPGSVVICGRPSVEQMALYYLGLALLAAWGSRSFRREKGEGEAEGARRRGSWRGRMACTVILVILPIGLSLRIHRGLSFTMLDVGQGDGLFLRTAQGTTLLIDGGSSSVQDVGRRRIIPFLKEQGVGRLNYVAATHTDKDHISGIEELILQSGEPGGIQVGMLLLSAQEEEREEGLYLRELARRQGIAVARIKAGDELRDPSTRIVCLHPKEGGIYGDPNGESMVLQVIYGEFSLLLTGDLEEEGEKEILEENRMGSCSVLKAGHHGSRTSTTEKWLEEVRPDVALVSCGVDNAYGHPHEETLERLRGAGIQVLLTSERGAIFLRSDGRRFWVESYL